MKGTLKNGDIEIPVTNVENEAWGQGVFAKIGADPFLRYFSFSQGWIFQPDKPPPPPLPTEPGFYLPKASEWVGAYYLDAIGSWHYVSAYAGKVSDEPNMAASRFPEGLVKLVPETTGQ